MTDGIFKTLKKLKKAQYDGKNDFEQTTRPGDFKFVDLNGDGRIIAEDRTFLGSSLPILYSEYSSSVMPILI